MGKLKFIKSYRDNEQYRESFFELANSVFGLNLKNWYQHGYWGNRYIPFSYIDQDIVVANVSINILDLVIEGKQKRAIQLGTVMTHPDYRNKGLSRKLMDIVLEEYSNEVDFIYLFANQSVLDFYPKFGFEIVGENQFFTDFSPQLKSENKLRCLDITCKNDIQLIYRLANERIPVSKRFSTANSQGILMYYCLNVLCNAIYYLESEDAIIIFTKECHLIEIFDIISQRKVNIINVLNEISDERTTKIVFHYTADYEELKCESSLIKGDGALFVKTIGDNNFPQSIKHPITSEA